MCDMWNDITINKLFVMYLNAIELSSNDFNLSNSFNCFANSFHVRSSDVIISSNAVSFPRHVIERGLQDKKLLSFFLSFFRLLSFISAFLRARKRVARVTSPSRKRVSHSLSHNTYYFCTFWSNNARARVRRLYLAAINSLLYAVHYGARDASDFRRRKRVDMYVIHAHRYVV